VANRFKYVGAYGVMDEGSGIYFMKNRYYNATTGRFIQKDPIGFAGGQTNLFAYAGQNPVNRIDPLGLSDVPPPPPIPIFDNAPGAESRGQLPMPLRGTKEEEDAIGKMWKNLSPKQQDLMRNAFEKAREASQREQEREKDAIEKNLDPMEKVKIIDAYLKGESLANLIFCP
jgi:RHS repeat-associated protein